MNIKENYEKIKSVAENVRVIAVTKYVDENIISEAYNAGIRDFGENKAKDAEEKKAKLSLEVNNNSTWHFIGHLQTNKVKKVVGKFDYIHSIDSLRLALLVNETAKALNITQKLLIQVNIAEEESKHGFNKNDVKKQFEQLKQLENINIVGLMTMAPFVNDKERVKNVFRELKELKTFLEEKFNTELCELSMGMSNDFQMAIEEGSTMIRIGQALFS